MEHQKHLVLPLLVLAPDQPLDDFQVGIGSTGVTINGELGKVEAEIIKAKEY